MSRTFTVDFNKAQLKEMEEGESLTVPTGSIFTVRPSAFNITPDARGILVENRDKVSVIFYVAGTMPTGTVVELELFSRVYQGALGIVTTTTVITYTDELVQLDIEDPLLNEADYVRITYKFKQGTAYVVSQLLANVKKKLTSLTESAMEWKGVWDANTNTPTLASGIGTNGDTYRVSVAGSTNLDGITDWKVGDWAIFNGGTVTWEKADNTDAVASVFSRIGAVVAAVSDYDASEIDNDSTVVGTFVSDALNTLKGPITLVNDSAVLTAADSHKVYAAIPGTGTDPIVLTLPTGGATAGIRFFYFNASGKSIRFLASGGETILLKTWGSAGACEIQTDDQFGFIEIISTGLGSYVIVSASGKWFDSTSPTKYRLFDGVIQDGGRQVYDTELGGHRFTTLAQRARGTITVVNLPIADETFVVNATTLTAKADGSGDIDHFTIGANTAETVANIVATLAECTEAANLTAWDGAGTTVVIEWGTAGVAGNAIVFTEALSNCTIDGGGTLGGTHTGVAAATLFTIGEDGAVGVPGTLGVTGDITAGEDIIMSAANTSFASGAPALNGAIVPQNTIQTNRAWTQCTGTTGNYILLCEYADRQFDFGHPQYPDPTWVGQSGRRSKVEYWTKTHDRSNAVNSTAFGGHTFTTQAQKARGTMTVGGIPIADETFVIDGQTITFKADGSGDVDQCTIAGSAAAQVVNILATLAECTNNADFEAWDGAGDTVVVEWDTAGVAGNAIVWTEAATNITVDGTGTLGATHAGIAAATLLDIDENGPAEIKYPLRGATSLWKNYRQISASSVGIGASGATFVPPDAAGANASIGGRHLDNAPSPEPLYIEFDVHNDWDGVSDIIVNLFFEQEDAGGGAGQTTVFDLEVVYKQPPETTAKGQSLTASTVTGAGGVKQQHKQIFTIVHNPGGGMDVEAEDLFGATLLWDDGTSTDATHPIVNHFEIIYLTKQPAIEA